jgi:uncharacterized protein YjiS (DUF1127 family)
MKFATLRIPAIFRLLATWRRRTRFRAQLRTDIEEAADFLRDIGIDVASAQMEVARFFWEPIALTRGQVPSADIVSRGAMEAGLQPDKLRDVERPFSFPREAKQAGADSSGDILWPT